MWTPPLEPCWLSPQPLSSFGLSHRDTFEPSHELPLAETLAWTILQKGQMQWSGQACFHLKVKLDKGTLKKMPFGVSMWSELDFIPWIRSCNVIPVHSHDRQEHGSHKQSLSFQPSTSFRNYSKRHQSTTTNPTLFPPHLLYHLFKIRSWYLLLS